MDANKVVVNVDQILRLPQVQMRVILFMMGIPYKRTSRPVTVLKPIIKSAYENDPVTITKAYNMVKYGLRYYADTGAPEESAVSESRIKHIVDSMVRNEVGSMFGEMTNELKHTSEVTAKKIATDIAIKEMKDLKPIVIKQGTKKRKIKGIMPAEFETLVKLASSRINTLMVGPSGCGKTFVASKVAEALGLDFASISCSVGMSESMLSGWLLPVGTGSKFEYVPSQFVQMYEKGGVFLLDEIDGADPNTMVFMNQAIANDFFFLPQRHKKPMIKKHKDFHLIAAANTFGNGADMMFVGRNQLDAATLDRFRAGVIKMDYSEKVEKAIIDPEVYEWGIHIRNKIAEHRLRRILSTRVMEDFTKMKDDHKWGRKEWEETYFSDWKEDEILKVLPPKEINFAEIVSGDIEVECDPKTGLVKPKFPDRMRAPPTKRRSKFS